MKGTSTTSLFSFYTWSGQHVDRSKEEQEAQKVVGERGRRDLVP